MVDKFKRAFFYLMIIPISLDEFYVGFVYGDGIVSGNGYQAGWRCVKRWWREIPEIVKRW